MLEDFFRLYLSASCDALALLFCIAPEKHWAAQMATFQVKTPQGFTTLEGRLGKSVQVGTSLYYQIISEGVIHYIVRLEDDVSYIIPEERFWHVYNS
jgi:hypothetical protein